jgi:hypothetical protein
MLSRNRIILVKPEPQCSGFPAPAFMPLKQNFFLKINMVYVVFDFFIFHILKKYNK